MKLPELPMLSGVEGDLEQKEELKVRHTANQEGIKVTGSVIPLEGCIAEEPSKEKKQEIKPHAKTANVTSGNFILTVGNVGRLIGVTAEVFGECMEKNFELSRLKNEENGSWKRPEENEIIERMYQTPVRLDFLGEIIVEVETMVKQTQFDIYVREKRREQERANERKGAMDVYNKRLEEFPRETGEFVKWFQTDVLAGKMTGAIAEKLIAQKKPEKPTVNYLEDVAIVKTNNLELEIQQLQRDLLKQEELLRRLQRVQRRFVDDKFVVQKHVDLLVAQVRNLGKGL